MSHNTSYTTNLLRSFEKILIVLNLHRFTVEKLKYKIKSLKTLKEKKREVLYNCCAFRKNQP